MVVYGPPFCPALSDITLMPKARKSIIQFNTCSPTIHRLHCSLKRSFLPHKSTNLYKTLVTYQIIHCISVLHAAQTTNTALSSAKQLIEWLPIKTRDLCYPHPLPLRFTPPTPLSVSLPDVMYVSWDCSKHSKLDGLLSFFRSASQTHFVLQGF